MASCTITCTDGMVVKTQLSSPVAEKAQHGVMELLLINHPLDCPVCDKGGECPLQDNAFRYGLGSSRMAEDKRSKDKAYPLSDRIALDKERCILCYRCVRFSQEISEDYQLILLERGAHSFVGTFDGHPYVGPFSGNIVELCPVGALTSSAYRFRARPWDIEGSGTVCAMCPGQCNVELTVRDDRVLRVLARDHEGVNDGWLCDKGRFGYQYTHSDERIVQPLMREGTELMPASWDKALHAAANALAKAGSRAAALASGETTNEEAFLLSRLMRERLGSSHLSSAPSGSDALPLDVRRALSDPALQAEVADLEFAHAVLLIDCDPIDDVAIFDLRLRKGIRRRGVKLAVAGARPTALDPSARMLLRYAPGTGGALLAALDAAFSDDAGLLGGAATAAGSNAQSARDLAEFLSGVGEDVVILYGERLLSGPRGAGAARALLNVATRLGLYDRHGAGLLEVPSSANGRGLREAGFAPGHGAGYATLAAAGRDADGIAEGLAEGELTTLYLLHSDLLRFAPDRAKWEAALGAAHTVIAHESVLTETVREHADIVFPAEAYPEKEGTLVQPDGRVQRLRPAIGRPHPAGMPGSGVRAGWQVVAEVARRAGLETGVHTGPMASDQLFAAVPFYAGLTLDEIGGRGVRWPETPAAASFAPPRWELAELEIPPAAASPNGALRLGTFRPLWAAKEVDLSPVLHFARAQQVVELAPPDAERLGIAEGDRVEVRSGAGTVTAAARLRASLPHGTVFVAAGTLEQPANVLAGPLAEVRRVGPPEPPEPSAVPAMVTPAGEGMAEMPASAPQPDPGVRPPSQSSDGSAP